MIATDNPFATLARDLGACVHSADIAPATGRVIEAVGTLARAHVPDVRVGEICSMRSADSQVVSEAEVIGFEGETAILALYGDMVGISVNTQVIATGRAQDIGVGDGLLGRVIDAMGRPLDEATRGPLRATARTPIYAAAPNPMTRQLVSRPMPMGVRAIDGLLTCGEGQRVGLFAAAGVGKSTLLSSLARGAQADVVVVALIGERGREVREFLEDSLGEEGLRRAVVVVATSDRPSMERARAAWAATAIAERFRDEGRKVLLLMDSVTRFARAMREIGLAAGEPPARRGFPPSVFAALPRLMERAGQGSRGSITAFYTVLVEGDDMTEPVADETRSILDGHIVLSRELASANHYPAIDILESTSRVMGRVAEKDHIAASGQVRDWMAAAREVELLVRIGEYQEGADARVDVALRARDAIRDFLRQDAQEGCAYDDTLARLRSLAQGGGG